MLGFALALLPLAPNVATRWDFYSQNGICLPLPITRQEFGGQNYSFGVFVVLNFAVFLTIGLGQIVIYRAVQGSTRATNSANSNTSANNLKKEIIIARRLFIVVFSDFCCWFPVGVMGLMAKSGVPIPGVVNVWTAVFILPLNSALNPFLYTFSKWKQKREQEKEAERYRQFVKKFQIEQQMKLEH